MFRDVENLKTRSPVRIAGVEVGKVDQGRAEGGRRRGRGDDGAARGRAAAPRRRAAQIRSRIFLEGNFFVDIQPGLAVERRARGRLHDADHADGLHGDAAGHPRHARLGRARRPPDLPARVRHRRAPRRRRQGVQPRDPVLPAGLPLRRAHERRAARRGPRPRRAAAPARPAAHLRGAGRQPAGAQGARDGPEHDRRRDREPRTPRSRPPCPRSATRCARAIRRSAS